MTVALYASVGPVLTHYAINVETAELTPAEAVSVGENIQYAWPHASGRFLYVASSNSASGLGPVGDHHAITAFATDPDSGALTQHGAPIPLPQRPIHIAADIPSRHILVAFSNPRRFSRLRHQPGRHPWRRGASAEPDRPRDLPPSGARNAGRQAGHPRHPRP